MFAFPVESRRALAPASPAPLRDEPEGSLSRTDQDHLGTQLRAMYDALCAEPLPERLQDLIGRMVRPPSE